MPSGEAVRNKIEYAHWIDHATHLALKEIFADHMLVLGFDLN